MPAQPLRMLILGAHPDDAEFHAGGLAAIYRESGHHVRMISVTNGAAGHHVTTGPELAAIRRREAAASGSVIGAPYITWEFPDGSLEPTLAVRHAIIREIRTFNPDLVLTHRTCDYHPDHRAVGQAVQDASFMVRVPSVVPEVPALRRDPVVAYMIDHFTRPAPLAGDVVIDVSDRIETIVRMLCCHASQLFEWLPYVSGRIDREPVPEGESARREYVERWLLENSRWRTDRFAAQLVETYGAERAAHVILCEAYEISQYAAPLDDAERRRLFPFLP